jgi:hypothetical protein
MGAMKDLDLQATRSKRGKNARARGNAFEREIAHRLNGTRIGWTGGPTDVATGVYDIQCKVGGSFPERIWGWLNRIPFRHDKLRAVVIGDSPGAGTKRRVLIVFDLTEFADFFGEPETPE